VQKACTVDAMAGTRFLDGGTGGTARREHLGR
jgi:hypothetical protein